MFATVETTCQESRAVLPARRERIINERLWSRGGPKFMGLVIIAHRVNGFSRPVFRMFAEMHRNEPAGHKQLTVTQHDTDISDHQMQQAVEVP